jgi:hypothetical protein
MATAERIIEHEGTRRAFQLCEQLFGEPPVIEAEFDLSRVNLDERVQVRFDKNNAPREMVNRFAWQMSESKFPPIVVTVDAVIVDGNTRAKARREREDRYVSAVVLPVNGKDADDVTKERLIFLGQALNALNGKPLDRKEQREMVRHSLSLGMSAKEIQSAAGVKANVVTAVRNEVAGEDKLLRVGLPVDLVRDTSLRALGKASNLNDAPFAELAKLTADAGFNAREVAALAGSVRGLGSDTLALDRVATERDANATRIAQRKEGHDGHPPASRQLRQKLGYINTRPPAAFVETNTDVMADYLDELKTAAAILAETITLQETRVAGLTA